MKEIVEEYGEYVVAFLVGIGVIAVADMLLKVLKAELLVFIETLC